MHKPSHRQWIAAGASLLVLAALAAGLLLYLFRDQLPPMEDVRVWIGQTLEAIPAPVYFLAFAILPTFGAPLTLFYLTALPVMGTVHPVIGIGLAWLAIIINMILARYMARGILHPAIEWIIRHKQLSIPKLKPHNEWRIVLAFRLSPVPFVFQNYLLALGHARWRTYLFLSFPIQAVIGLAVMLLGESVIKGGLGYILTALFVVLILHFLFDAIRKRLTRETESPQN